MKKIISKSLVAAGLLTTCAVGNELPSIQPYLGVGTAGATLGARYNINENFAVSGDINGFAYNKSFTAKNVDFDGKLKMFNAGVYGDYFPFADNFHISAGLIFGNDKVDATAKHNAYSTIKLNGVTYNFTPNDKIDAQVKFAKVRPYLGIGYASRSEKGFGFFANVGVAYGKMKTDVSPSAILRALPDFDYNLEQERNKIQDKANKYLKFYPVVKFGVSYAF